MKNLLIIFFLLVSIFSFSQVKVVTLNGSASFDPDNNLPLKFHWTQIGTLPSQCIIARPDSAITTVVPASGAQWIIGKYQFKLIVTDALGASAADTVNINVLPNPDKQPVAMAGADINVTLPPKTVARSAFRFDDVAVLKRKR